MIHAICPFVLVIFKRGKIRIRRLASLIHSGLNLSHYSSDFIVHPKKKFMHLINTLPGLLRRINMEKALLIGSDMPEL